MTRPGLRAEIVENIIHARADVSRSVQGAIVQAIQGPLPSPVPNEGSFKHCNVALPVNGENGRLRVREHAEQLAPHLLCGQLALEAFVNVGARAVPLFDLARVFVPQGQSSAEHPPPLSIPPPTTILHGVRIAGRQAVLPIALSYWDVVSQQWLIPTGSFGFDVGFSSRDLRDRFEATIVSE